MKKVILFFVMLLSFVFFYGQYKPIPLNNTSRWYVGKDNGGNSYRELLEYFIKGDTIINFNSYKKLYRITYLCDDNINLGMDPIDVYDQNGAYPYSGYVGAIRQDSSQKKVYFVPINTFAEFVLYDFTNKSIGDTLKIWNQVSNTLYNYRSYSGICDLQIFYYQYYGYLALAKYVSLFSSNPKIYKYEMEVNRLDSVLQKCYYLSYWIEGIGSAAGLLEHVGMALETGSSYIIPTPYILLCFESNGQVRYPFSDTTKCCCDSVVGNFRKSNKRDIQVLKNEKVLYDKMREMYDKLLIDRKN